MLNNLIIRRERPEDYKATEFMTLRSFWNKYWPGCTEHYLIRIIRESKDYLPEISRVAELDGRIVGAVYYTKAWIVDGDVRHEVATFGPLAVEPTLEGNDIGGALMRETIKLAKAAGIAGIVLMGEPNYYPRFGFRRGAEFGRHVDGVDHILACLILCLIGANMIREGLSRAQDAPATGKGGTAKVEATERRGALSLFLLAVATSIDALAVGISFGVMGNVSIAKAAALIGVTTAALSSVGLWIGALFGAKSKSKAELAGGVLLVAIGVKILVEGFL